MPEGQIIRGLSSFYYVESNSQVLECKARGIFKKRNESLLVGDYVIFDIVNNVQGYITEIKPRKTELFRPPISNVEQAILVFSIKEPKFSQLLLDKLLVHVELAKIKPIICITKYDLLDEIDPKIESLLLTYQEMGYPVIKTSKEGLGIEDLKKLLKDKISVFAGQSGVGKSTLLNCILPNLQLQTGIISKRLGRGKHTTREVQLIHLLNGGMVADTPGFSQLDFQGINPEELEQYFVDFDKWRIQCRFRGCLHNNEPGCAVKTAVAERKINPERYQHYLEFLQELKDIEHDKWR